MPLRFINPNFHVILIHYPLGVFVLGVCLELWGLVFRRHLMRTAARWMIVFGALLTLPAATSGLYALHDVQKNQGITDARYVMLRWHVIYMGAAALLAVFCAVVGLGASDKWRRRLYVPLLLGVIGAWGLMVVGAWHGGETIYQQGTSVAIVGTDKDKYTIVEPKPDADPVEDPSKYSNTDELRAAKYDRAVKYYAGGELQHHLILAGLALALAMGALGLSMRRLNAGESVEDDVVVRGISAHPPGVATRASQRRITDDISMVRSFNPDTSVGAKPASDVPAGRTWILSAIMVLLTIVAGYWVIKDINALEKTSFLEFKDKYIVYHGWPLSRPQAHFYLGGAFFVLTLILGMLAWLAPKRGILLSFFGLLLTLVIAAQVWVGVLMLYDSNKGTLYHFRTEAEKNPPATSATDSPATSGTTDTSTSGTTQPAPTNPVETPVPVVPANKPALETLPPPVVPTPPPAPTPTPAPVVPTPPPAPAPTPEKAVIPPAPIPDKPATDKPATETPATDKPATDKPATDKPTPVQEGPAVLPPPPPAQDPAK